jgi:superoxide dismutase
VPARRFARSPTTGSHAVWRPHLETWLSNFLIFPYAYDALGPYMSKETLEFHHDKHHQAYVTNGNNLLKDSGHEGKSLEDICKAALPARTPGLSTMRASTTTTCISGTG